MATFKVDKLAELCERFSNVFQISNVKAWWRPSLVGWRPLLLGANSYL